MSDTAVYVLMAALAVVAVATGVGLVAAGWWARGRAARDDAAVIRGQAARIAQLTAYVAEHAPAEVVQALDADLRRTAGRGRHAGRES